MSVLDTASQLGAKLTEIADNVGDVSRVAGKALQNRRGDTADALQNAAAALRTASDQVRDTIDQVVEGVASKLETAASYVEGGGRGRQFAAGQIIVAASVAFLIGFAMWRFTRGQDVGPQ
jgi:ABC-type transporter Mla subunit MlaD